MLALLFPGQGSQEVGMGRDVAEATLMLSVIAAFDERFEIHLSEDDINVLQSVEDILTLLRRHEVLAGN